MSRYLHEADILLPDLNVHKGEAWAVIACDQHTAEPEYWQAAREAANGPSTLDMILPEVYLEEAEARLPRIHETMARYEKELLVDHPGKLLLLERTLSDGRVRRGLVGCVDLEDYDYQKGAESLIRATEGTVLERIPPRVAVRRGACLELPHVMLLIDDPERTVIEPMAEMAETLDVAYDFDLMLDGGHVKGYFLDGDSSAQINRRLSALVTPEAMAARYGEAYAPLLFAVGDGNHSLASAKAYYEELKAQLGEAAAEHPARYALCEVVNLHDDSLRFEPIYRVMFGVSPAAVVAALGEYAEGLCGDQAPQTVDYVHAGGRGSLVFRHPVAQLTVGTLGAFIDAYLADHKEASVDYIHGEAATEALAKQAGAIGFLFAGMEKHRLFKTVICEGALPRKTFSIGHARDKRYYLECRRITKQKREL